MGARNANGPEDRAAVGDGKQRERGLTNPDGTSNCNPSVKFVSDLRGTRPFFAAFRPYVFSQFGKAGNRALYHWVCAADTQFGEVDFTTGNTYLSYWVDYWLGQMVPSTPTLPGPDISQLSVTETTSVEILGTKNGDGSVAILIVDDAVHAPTDNNGVGDPRTVIADVSALGTFSSTTSITINKNTSPTSGPAAVSIAPAQKISVTLGWVRRDFRKGEALTAPTSLRQQAEHDAIGRANIDSPVHDDRRDEFVASELVAAVSGLVGVIELCRKIRGIVSVKHSCTAIFNRPHNAVGRADGGDAWRSSWIRKLI